MTIDPLTITTVPLLTEELHPQPVGPNQRRNYMPAETEDLVGFAGSSA